MHTVAVQLAPILGAEKSKVPFYIAGGLLVAWALLLSLGIGARRSDFPANAGQQRGLIAVTVVLVLAAVSMAVVTSGGSKSEASAGAPASSTTPAETTGTETTSSAASTTTQPTATTSLKLAANPEGQLSYDAKALSAPAGTVTITMTNMSPVEHNVTIAEGSKVIGATPTFAGGSKAVTVKLKPGKYTFYCSVPGHRQAGMEGTLTVS
ncbi:MAG TPA: plastocyanin/azurin family copper-binding protein [Solirubrobacteraceae bacterium]|jgi:plastocyanin|nr:plastocyanin/azurin family copper-binding protein [Solirubrobacteraceae bacterium]